MLLLPVCLTFYYRVNNTGFAEAALHQPKLLAVGNDPKFLALLTAEAANWSVKTTMATDLTTVKNQLEQIQPNIVVFDLLLAELEEGTLAFLTEFTNRTPPLPVIVLTEFNQLADRLTVSRLKGWSVLQKPTAPAQIFAVATQILQKTQTTAVKILAVDDDPLILTTLQALLAPWGINVLTLQHPDQFWQRLPEVSPDLIMLDVEMPDVNGVELCQMLRDDPHWNWLPVLFLTARTDTQTIAQIFTAGADDYINKPILAPELVARILNRLERQRSLRSHIERSHGSNRSDRQQFTQDLNRFLKLAKRFQQPLCLAILEITPRPQLQPSSPIEIGSIFPDVERLMRQQLHEEDILTHWQGNRWVVGLYGMTRRESVEWLAAISETLHEKQFNLSKGEPVAVTLNAGVAQYPEDGGNLQLLYQSAETLLTHASPEVGRVLPVGWQPQPQDAIQTDVLLVYPDSPFAASIIHALETRGYHYRWLQSGKTALDAIEGTAPKLRAAAVLWAGDLSDVKVLPFLKRWKKHKLARNTRLILLLPTPTAEIDQLLALTAFDYVMTPCSPNVVMQCLYRALQFSPL
ncbi:MAG TPA: response regulator [Allocoleopsis sp.]